MLEDLDETLRQLLVAEIPIKNGEVDIKFHQPKREWSARLTRPTINFFLYDIKENVALRRHQWETMKNGTKGKINGARHIAQMKRSPYRLDCHYMITVWATEPEDEHQLLSSTMMALLRFPTLPAGRLIGDMQTQPFDIQARLASHDKMTNPAEIWGALDNEIRPSISYVMTVAFDPWSEIEVPRTRTFTLRTGQSSRPMGQRLNEEDGLDLETHYIGGIILADDEPQPNLRVSLKGTSRTTETDEAGRFVFRSLQTGDYTLIAWPEEGGPVEKTISVPAKEGDYDIAL